MNKTENGLLGLVELPDDSSAEEIAAVRCCLQNAGFSDTDIEWLIDIFKRRDCFGDPTGEFVFRNEFRPFVDELKSSLETLLKEWTQGEKDGQTRLMLLFSSMLTFGPEDITSLVPNDQFKESKDRSEDIPKWISEFQKYAKFCAKSLDWKKLSKTTQFDKLLPFLFPEGVPIDQIVDLKLLNPIRRSSWSTSNDFRDPKQLEFWLRRRFEENKERRNIINLRTLVSVFAKFPEDVLGNKILGLCNAIFYTMNSGRSLNPVGDGWQAVAHELIPFFELLNVKKPELNQERSPLLKTWWHLAKHIFSWGYGGLESELSDDLRDRLVESASRHIGILRSILREKPEVFEENEVNDFYNKAFYVLLSFAPAWKRLKPLLLAFIGMTKQAVAKDLRTWREHDSTDNPPETYSRVANWIEVAMYPQNLREELERDPHLQELREEFAKFCLGRLRTKIKNKNSDYTNEDFVEPRPVWRGCYIQALKVLRVNPGGRAHKTLFWLRENDPNADVREYAKRVHKQVRHLDRNKPNLDKGTSPRRQLFEAWWWIRQAHLITLGVEVDKAGAMRTRRQELRRTREKDDRFDRKG